MGLAIYLYTGLKKIEDARRDADTDELFLPDGTTVEYDQYLKVYQDPYFASLNRHAGVELGAYYLHNDGERVFGRSYGGYSAWREWLAKIAGYPLTQYEDSYTHSIKECHAAALWPEDDGEQITGPFAELINFSDCEGTLGPVTCAKLAKDFEQFMEKVESESEQRRAAGTTGPDYFLEGYKQLAEATKRAGVENGVLVFC